MCRRTGHLEEVNEVVGMGLLWLVEETCQGDMIVLASRRTGLLAVSAWEGTISIDCDLVTNVSRPRPLWKLGACAISWNLAI